MVSLQGIKEKITILRILIKIKVLHFAYLFINFCKWGVAKRLE